jgi:hypothetical protein
LLEVDSHCRPLFFSLVGTLFAATVIVLPRTVSVSTGHASYQTFNFVPKTRRPACDENCEK